MKQKKRKFFALALAMLLAVAVTGCGITNTKNEPTTAEKVTITDTNDATIIEEIIEKEVEEIITAVPNAGEASGEEAIAETASTTTLSFDASSIPSYSGTDVIVVNNDEPYFTDDEKVYSGTYINLSELDSLGRCGVAMACVGQETEPTEERGDISKVKPSGWVQTKYKDWLYNRSHLLMFALTGLNDDNRNLITGTEYFNQTLMLGYESMIHQVVDKYNAHVVYRVTPVFEGNNLVAKGVLMEAYCIEYPAECTFCVFVYNIADPAWNVEIDYSTGESWQNN